MKNILFPISLLLILAFANCQTDNQSLELKKGLMINSSVTFDSTTIEGYALTLQTNNNNEKIITIQGDSLTVDFNGISLVGTDDFTKPDEFKGVAIHIKNSNFVTIKNLNVSGYRVALQADSVEYLTIDSCNFSYNYRADSSANFDIEKVTEGAITLNHCINVNIIHSIISHNYNGIVANKTRRNLIEKNAIQFNSKVGIHFRDTDEILVKKNKIDWNLSSGIWWYKPNNDAFYQNSLTHNGIINYIIPKAYKSNDFTASVIDFEIPKIQFLKDVPKLDPKYPKGEAYKLPTKYGVYDFEYPAIFLRTVKENEYVFAMFGPSVGNWKFVASENVASVNLKTGTFPATFRIKKEDIEQPFSLTFEFIGERFQDEFGVWNKKGKVYQFDVEM